MLTDAFDRTVIISLPERKDRRREMSDSLAMIGARLSDTIIFFDAIRPVDKGSFHTIGAHGAYLSHLAVLEGAAERDESVLILEDDCDFDPAACHFEVPANCELLFAGYEAVGSDDPHHATIQGAHCTGYSRGAARMAATYLRSLLDPEFPPDPQAEKDASFNPAIKPPFDGALVWFRRKHPELNVVFNNISHQRPSRSDITPLRLERWPLLRLLLKTIRRLVPSDTRLPHIFSR